MSTTPSPLPPNPNRSGAGGSITKVAAAKTTPANERPPEWPPRRGTPVSLFLDESGDAVRAEILDVHGRTAQIRVSRRIDPPADGAVKVLMSGACVDWGYDMTLIEVDPRGSIWRAALLRGPLRIMRDPSERIVEKTLVVFRKQGVMFPGHVLERGRNELLCIVGRGVPFDEGDLVNIEFPGKQFPDVEDAVVSWNRPARNGLEFTLALPRPLDSASEIDQELVST